MVTASESKESTGLQQSFGGATSSKTRIKLVEFDSTEIAVATDINASFHSGFTLGNPDADLPNLYCQNINTARDTENPLLFRVTATFAANQFDGGEGPETGGAVFPIWNVTSKATPKLVYRLPGTTQVPSRGDPDPNLDLQDIEGEPFDVKGERKSVLDVQPQISVTVRREVSINAPGNYISTVLSAVGKRNQGRFLGAFEGQLLLTNITTRRVVTNQSTKTYDITFTFVFDREYHLAQVAVNTDKRPSGISLGKDDNALGCPTPSADLPNYCEHAYPVTYVQPFPDKFNFGGLGINIR